MAFYLHLFTNLYKCFYLFFACPYFNGCFPSRNHHCSFIIQFIAAKLDLYPFKDTSDCDKKEKILNNHLKHHESLGDSTLLTVFGV